MSKFDWDKNAMDINEFMTNEWQIDFNYSYIYKFNNDDSKMLKKAYKSFLNFMKYGNFHHHIKERTLGYYNTFGLDGFFS